MELKSDICIVGGGFTAGLVAEKMADHCDRIIMLERGGDYIRPADGAPPWSTPRESPAGQPFITNTGSKRYRYDMRFGVGGSLVTWGGICFRMHASDFRMKSLYGLADDWPISYDDIEPYYCDIEDEVGVAGLPDPNFSYRSRPFPMEGFPLSYTDIVSFEIFKPHGFTMSLLPQARNSVFYRGRAACCGAQTCVEYCPVDARYRPDTTHIKWALAKGNVELKKECIVTHLEADENGRIRRVHVKKPDGATFTVTARIFALCANAMENTRLLMLSRNDTFPHGLANASGMLGKYFFSTGGCEIKAHIRQQRQPNRGPLSTSIITDWVDGPFRKYRPAAVFELWNPGLTPEYYSGVFAQMGYFGRELKDQVKKFYGTDFHCTMPFDCLPYEPNRLTLNESVVDSFGMNVANVHFDFTDYELKGSKFIVRTLEEIVRRAGGFVKHTFYRGLNGNHPMGTYRMGLDPKTSVVSDKLQSHDHKNLFIFGGGAHITGGAVNPSMTIGALTLRALPHFHDTLKGL
jgi:choline dehydrogenase-like flavoprotein